jgi:corrinoid protein of di/trimethylamine methyltransferase
MNDFLRQCEESVLKGDKQLAGTLASRVLEEGLEILHVVENGFAPGIRKAGTLFEEGEYFLPELAFSAEAMKTAMDVLQPALLAANSEAQSKGVVIIGTIQGDIHDIGKTLVATMLSANGFRVIDLGADVQYSRFVDEAKQHERSFVCMSALLTTTMSGQAEVVNLLKEAGLKDNVKVVVGGAPTSTSWAEEIGADGHAGNAVEAVQVLDSLIK